MKHKHLVLLMLLGGCPGFGSNILNGLFTEAPVAPNMSLKDDHLNRIAIGGNFHPWTRVDLMAEYRQTWTGGTVLLLKSELTEHEVLVMAHAWF
jgi:hypothetical protein